MTISSRSPRIPGTRRFLTQEERKSYEGRFELSSLFEFSSIVNASFDLDFILGHFLLTLMGKLLSQRGIILLQQKKNIYNVASAKGLPLSLIGTGVEIRNLPRRLIHVEGKQKGRQEWLSFFREQGIHFLVPLTTGKKNLGLAGFAPLTHKTKLSEKEATYVKSLANIASSAVEKSLAFSEIQRVNRRLDNKVQELNTLFEVSKEFNALLEPDRILKLLMYSILGQIGVRKYFICLTNNGEMDIVAARLEHEVSKELRKYFLTVSRPVMVNELIRNRDREFRPILENMGIQLLIPLRLQHQPRGLLGVGEKVHGGGFLQSDIEFLLSLGNLAVISLENARLFREAIEKQKLEDELLIAKEIQRRLLPVKLPTIPHFDTAATNISSKQVGGDYYDVISLGGSKYVVAIGDVSGKGTPASLLMANLQATIRALVPLSLPLSELTKRVNDLIFESTNADRFITFFWGVLDVETRSVKYVSAGHNPPMLFRATGEIERLEKGGIILGVMKTVVPYEEGEIRFTRGDTLLLFTDGVSEAMNVQGEEFGEDQLEKIAKQCLDGSSKMLISHIVEAVQDHSRNTMQSDDITMLALKQLS